MSEFKVGDKVQVKDDEDSIKSMLAFSIPLKDIEAMKGKVFEVLAVSSTGEGTVYLKSPRSGNRWWFEPEHVTAEVEPHVFKVGDRVKVVSTEERLIEIGVGNKEFRRRLLAGEAAEVVHERKQGEGHKEGGILRLSLPDAGDHWEVYVNMVELAGDEVEPDWDPMTEKLQVGDLVEVVWKNHEHTGKRGHITKISNTGRHFHVDGEFSKSERRDVGVENGKGVWTRECIKLLKKADEKAEVPEWDPMTEPIHMGDLVEVVFDNEHKGKQGRVTRCDNPESGRWGVTQDNGKSAGDSWSRRGSLKLIEKAEGTPASKTKVKAKEGPPPGLAQGDEVRILHTTREFQEQGHSVVTAARLSRRKGKIALTDDTEPKWYVDVDGVGGVWCNTEKLEKLSA